MTASEFLARIRARSRNLLRTHRNVTDPAEAGADHRDDLGTDAVNGAVLAGFFDCAPRVAGRLQFPDQRAGTVELSIKFIRPTRGDSLTAQAGARKRADNLAFVESGLYCANRLCAVATGMVSTAGWSG